MNITPPNPDPNPVTSQREIPARSLARLFFILACAATLIALFYLTENWRGNRVWKKYRHEFEAQGNSLNWADFIPPKVPDEQNAFKAPKMQEWFVRAASNYSVKVPDKSFSRLATDTFGEFSSRLYTIRTNIVVAELTVAGPTGPYPEKAGVALDLNDSLERERAQNLINGVTGPTASGAQGFLIFAQPFEQLKPVNFLLKTDKRPSLQEVSAFFEVSDKLPSAAANRFSVVSAGTNAFRIYVNSPPCLAADYLEWSNPLETDFDLMREALKRPFARMEGDYEQPAVMPIVGFVRLRQVAQILAQRTQCYLLLGQPEAAFHDLTLIRKLCFLLEGKPTGKPMTLVAAMINVAIAGLYTSTVADGLRLHAWREQELIGIGEQLKQVDLPPIVAEAFRAEAAFTCRHLETGPRSEFANLLAFGPNQASGWEKLKSPRFMLFMLMPQGWIHQNMAAVTFTDQKLINALNYTNNVVHPRQVDSLFSELQNTFGRFSPCSFIATTAVPNFQKATQVLAHNQALADLALLACTLERYHLMHGQYPEKLDALTPQFLKDVPHDIVGGRPLKYRRTERHYVLYSIGWNETDDGGISGKANADGDWLWDYKGH